MEKYFANLPTPECGICVNGIPLEREVLGYRTSSVKGRDNISTSIEEIETCNVDGSTYRRKKEESKDIEVTFNITAEDKSHYIYLKDKLKTLLLTDIKNTDLLTKNGVNILDGMNEEEIYIGKYPEQDSEEAYTEGPYYNTNIVPMNNEYVVSFEAKSTVNGDIIACYLWRTGEESITSIITSQGWVNTGSNITSGYARIKVSTEWKRYYIKYRQDPSVNTQSKLLRVGRLYKNSGSGEVSIRKIKMEKGLIPTFKFPNPNDLNITENKSKELKVCFRDEPDKYIKCTVSGLEFEELNTSGMNVYSCEGKIKLRLSQPYRYAVYEKTAIPSLDDNTTFLIDYKGTQKTYPVFEIINNSDNGYVAFVNDNGNLIQAGNPDEIDKKNYEASEELITVNKIMTLPDTGDKINYLHPHYITGGSMHYTSESLKIKGLPTNRVDGKWYSALRTIEIPADSNGYKGCVNFYCYINHWIETGLMGQTGEISIMFLDKSNKVVCGYNIFKNDMSGNTAVFEMWANNKCVRSIAYTPSFSDYQNPFNFGRGHSDIRKEGGKITFYWWGEYPSYNFPELANVEIKKIQFSFAQYGTRNLTDQYITRMYLRQFSFSKMKVSKWKDVPNKFKNKDVVKLDCNSGDIYHKGKINNSLGAIGNDWENFYLKPGLNQIKCLNSSWVTNKPDFKIKYREVYK